MVSQRQHGVVCRDADRQRLDQRRRSVDRWIAAANATGWILGRTRRRPRERATTILRQVGCEHYNTIPRFQPGTSESTLMNLLIGLLSTQAGETADFQSWTATREPYAE